MKLSLLASFVYFLPQADAPGVAWRTLAIDDRRLEYAVVLPVGFDPEASHPLLVALPPGGGGRELVLQGLELYFAAQARERGWVVVSPVAPEGRGFHEGGRWVAALCDALERDWRIEGRLHLAGVSNGGRGAFRVALQSPERFASLTVLPGMPAEEDRARLAELAQLPVALHVGADDDGGWRDGAVRTAEQLRESGAADVVLDVRAGEGHVLAPEVAGAIFDRLDRLRAAERERAAARAEIGRVLDDLHDAAARADEERYFGCFAPDAIFIGTDATERWTVAEFREYAREPFERETAWTYTPLERHVELARDGATAWFDERLANAKYGETRGSGVLVRRGGRWLVAHYVLSFAIPNDAAREVVEAVGRTAK